MTKSKDIIILGIYLCSIFVIPSCGTPKPVETHATVKDAESARAKTKAANLKSAKKAQKQSTKELWKKQSKPVKKRIKKSNRKRKKEARRRKNQGKR